MALEHTRPRFRTDLVAQPLEVGGKRFIDVTDPDTEETFRFYEVEYSVACAMDGERDVSSLIGWARDELGLEPQKDEVELVIGTLADLGYLSNGENDVELGSPGPSSAPAPSVELPDTSDVELGTAGGTPSQRVDAVTAAENVELGTAGKAAGPPAGGSVTMGWDVPDVSALMGGDGALGPSGDDSLGLDADMPPPPESAVPKATLKPSGNSASDEDGPTHIPAPATDFENDDVSVDLSDHLSIGTSDVKEAVRQSKVMQAVEIPADLAAAIESEAEPSAPASPAELAPEKKKPEVAHKAEPEPAKQAGADKDAKTGGKPSSNADSNANSNANKKSDKKSDKKSEQAAKPAVEAPAAAARAPESSSSGLLVFLILLLAAGGGGAYWYFKIYKAGDGATTADPKTSTKPVEPPPQKQPDPPPVKLVEAAPIELEVGAVADGKLEWIADSGIQVEEGDVVAKFKGVSSVERSLQRPRRKLEEYSAKLDEAKEAANAGAIKRYEAKVDEKAQLVAAGEEQLALLTMTAPQAGTVDVVASVGVAVAKGAPVVKVTGERGLAATFPAPKGSSYEVGGECEIAAKKTPDKPIACTVTAVEGDSVSNRKVSIRIATDVGLAAGEAVILK